MATMNVIKLIELVKQYPILYSTFHADYSKPKLKDDVYQKIGKQMKIDGNIVKENWLKLRDCHREALRRQKRKIEKGERIRQWNFQKEMEFLLPYMKSRPEKKNLEFIAGEDTDEESEACDIKPTEFAYPDIFSSKFEDNATNEADVDKKIPAKKRKTMSDNLMTENEIQSDQNTNTQQNSVASTEDNGMRCFFSSMWLLTKDLPPYYQRKLRSKVLQTVSDIEESYEKDSLNVVPSSSNQ